MEVFFFFFFARFGSYLWDAYIKYKIDGYMPLRGLAVKYERLSDGGGTQWKEPGCLSLLLRRKMQKKQANQKYPLWIFCEREIGLFCVKPLRVELFSYSN